MEGKILETDDKPKLPALNSEDALLFSKVAGYVHRIDKQVFYFFIIEVFSLMTPSHKHTKVLLQDINFQIILLASLILLD